VEISAETVLGLCKLAKLELSQDELEQMQRDLARILAHVEQLAELDTRGVEPTTHVLGLVAPLRRDAVADVLPAERALANAPQTRATALVVPQVKEE
jgi:aspartyl-tRNA(Asn)/glutamyl-tRNA(Gln) amidotransferase subunit C